MAARNDLKQAAATAGLALLLLLAMQTGCGSSGGAVFNSPSPVAPRAIRVETFLANANFPVAMAFASDGRLFYNELLTGQVRLVVNGVLQAQPFATLPVLTGGERGLLGLALDPQFASNGFVYVLYSDASGVNRVVRFADMNGVGVTPTVIVDNLPQFGNHNGGNLGFGADGRLYITVGDAGNPANSQDPNARAGKILRFNANGSVPTDNPFGTTNPAFNLGLRNSFDFTFHPQSGVIYASENGPDCDDELNRVVRGGNYGWRPNYPCGDADPQYVAPLTRFNPVIAPTGVTFYTSSVIPQFQGSLFMVDFNQGRVRRFAVNEALQGMITLTEIVVDGGMGNLLDIVQSPDGALYFSSTTTIFRIVSQ